MSVKSRNLFDTIMKGTLKTGPNSYECTSNKRRSLIVPKGVTIFDTDVKKLFVGDETTYGGIAENTRMNVRKVAVNAAATGATYTSGVVTNAGTFTWADAQYLRTGDAITLASGAGTLPSGITAGTYYITKTDDSTLVDEGNLGTRFKLASTRANAIAGTNVSGATSGASGATFTSVIADLCIHGFEDILYINPMSAAIDVVLPYASGTSVDGFSVTIKPAYGATAATTIKDLDASGNVQTPTIDSTGAAITIASGASGHVTIVNDKIAGEWFTIAKDIA